MVHRQFVPRITYASRPHSLSTAVRPKGAVWQQRRRLLLPRGRRLPSCTVTYWFAHVQGFYLLFTNFHSERYKEVRITHQLDHQTTPADWFTTVYIYFVILFVSFHSKAHCIHDKRRYSAGHTLASLPDSLQNFPTLPSYSTWFTSHAALSQRWQSSLHTSLATTLDLGAGSTSARSS